MSPTHPILLLGGGSLGSVDTSTFHTVEAVKSLLHEAAEHGVNRIDTAGRYPSDNIGESERLLGQAGVASQGFLVDTKIMLEGTDPSGTLSLEAIRKSVPISFEKLQVVKLNTLYNHTGDPTTPLEEQVRAMDEQYKKGSCLQLGLSNLSPDVLSSWLEMCDEKGYTKPKVYQGMYSLIRREAEATLFPILRKHGMHFVAFSPLGGGFLTGNLTKGNTQGTRAGGTGVIAKAFRSVFDKPEMHEAMKRLHSAIDPISISPVEAALRWLSYHSELGPDDGIILGASKTGQLSSNVEAIDKGPLPEQVVLEIENVWAILDRERSKAP